MEAILDRMFNFNNFLGSQGSVPVGSKGWGGVSGVDGLRGDVFGDACFGCREGRGDCDGQEQEKALVGGLHDEKDRLNLQIK